MAAQIAFRNIPNLQEIIDSVVSTNISRVTPPPSRSNTPPPRNPLSRTSSRLHLGQPTQSSSALQVAPSTAVEKWSSLSSRRSNRRFDARPWGPRHLEYDYNEARKEFQSAAYYALGQFGYVPPSRTALAIGKVIVNPNSLPSMNNLRRIALFRSACERLDAADAALEEAIARGETWENTPVPVAYRSLEGSKPEDIRSVRTDEPERSRSALTFEEEASFITSPIAPSSNEFHGRERAADVTTYESVSPLETRTTSSTLHFEDVPVALGHYSRSSSLSSSGGEQFTPDRKETAMTGQTSNVILPQASTVVYGDPQMSDFDKSREPMSGRSTPSSLERSGVYSRSNTPVNNSPTIRRKRGRPRKNRD